MSLDALPHLCFERVCDFLPLSAIFALRKAGLDFYTPRLRQRAAAIIWRAWQRSLHRYERYYESLISQLGDADRDELNKCAKDVSYCRRIITRTLTNPTLTTPLMFHSTGLQNRRVIPGAELSGYRVCYPFMMDQCNLITHIRPTWAKGKHGVIAVYGDNEMVCGDITMYPSAVISASLLTLVTLRLIRGDSPTHVAFIEVYLLDYVERFIDMFRREEAVIHLRETWTMYDKTDTIFNPNTAKPGSKFRILSGDKKTQHGFGNIVTCG